MLFWGPLLTQQSENFVEFLVHTHGDFERFHDSLFDTRDALFGVGVEDFKKVGGRRLLGRQFVRAEHDPVLCDLAAEAGNGHEWHNLSGRAKALLAIAVVDYDLWCSSITRSWGTGSHHEDVPTRGFDCAGARMTEFQQDLRYGRIEDFELGDLLELFGPDNAACADNGFPYSMAEGSGIEQLHDNHTHAFVYGA